MPASVEKNFKPGAQERRLLVSASSNAKPDQTRTHIGLPLFSNSWLDVSAEAWVQHGLNVISPHSHYLFYFIMVQFSRLSADSTNEEVSVLCGMKSA
jgi:hypothetical protein